MAAHRLLVVLSLAIAATLVTAFAPSEQAASSANSKWSVKTSTYAPMKRVGFATPPPSFNRNHCAGGVCMSTDPKNTDGTVYDDEPMLEPPRETLSNSMKERLIREASTGLDSDKSQTNVILYVSVVVALLVALGGQGILY